MPANVSKSKMHKIKLARSHDLIMTNYHEAGHTIYGLLKFMKVEEVSVFFNEESKRAQGTTCYEMVIDENINDHGLLNFWTNSEIGLSYAGQCAEKYYFKTISGSDVCPMYVKDGSSSDTLEAANIIRKYNLAAPGKERYSFKKKKINETSKLIIKYWSDVVLLSHSLFKRNKLNFNDLRKILCSNKSNNKDFWKDQFKTIDYLSAHDLDNRTLKTILLAN